MPPTIQLSTPERVTAALLVVVGATELSVMGALGHVSGLPWWALTLVDTAALTAVVSLLIWPLVISPLRHAVERERASAQLVLDHAAEGIITIDATGTILAFNRAAERVFGYSSAEAVGRSIDLIVPPDQRAQHDASLGRYLERVGPGTPTVRRQVMAARRDGTPFPIEMSISATEVGGERLVTAILLDITERRQFEERIGRLAHFDELTALPNRVSFLEQLDRLLALAERQQQKVGLLFLDLDGFKPVNDALGHEAGDRLLQLVAARLNAQARESDYTARLGGDEFTVILPLVSGRAAAEEAARRIGHVLAQPFDLGPRAVTIGASIGIALFPDDATDAKKLIHVADTRMYDAKGSRAPGPWPA